MMLVISNPACVRMLRTAAESNTEVVERAICRRIGITPRRYRGAAMGRPKVADKTTCVPVKITDERIIEFILLQKRTSGAPYRHTAESAMLAQRGRKRGSK